MRRAAALAVLAAVSGLFGHWSTDRRESYIAISGTAVPPEVAPSGSLRIDWKEVEVFKTNCTVVYQREIIDAENRIWTFAPLPSGIATMGIGKHFNVQSTVPWPIPSGIAVGKAKAYSRVTSLCNPVQRMFSWPVVYQTAASEFVVVKPKDYYHEQKNLRLDKQTYAPGEPIRTTNSISRHMPKDCSLFVARYITNAKTGVVGWSQIIEGVAQNGAGQTLTRTIAPPEFLDGEYVFLSVATNVCKELSLSATSDPVRFAIRSPPN
jgi:hypothetical protein